MSEFEIFIRNEGSEYGDGFVLNKYGDRYSLIAAREGKGDGTLWKEWAFPQGKDKQPREKAIPLGVRLGNRVQAIAALRKAIAALEGAPAVGNADPAPKPKAGAKDDADLPF